MVKLLTKHVTHSTIDPIIFLTLRKPWGTTHKYLKVSSIKHYSFNWVHIPDYIDILMSLVSNFHYRKHSRGCPRSKNIKNRVCNHKCTSHYSLVNITFLAGPSCLSLLSPVKSRFIVRIPENVNVFLKLVPEVIFNLTGKLELFPISTFLRNRVPTLHRLQRSSESGARKT